MRTIRLAEGILAWPAAYQRSLAAIGTIVATVLVLLGCKPMPSSTRSFPAQASIPVIDFVPRRLTLDSQVVRVPVQIEDGAIFAPGNIAGASSRYLIDTGFNTVLILPELAAASGLNIYPDLHNWTSDGSGARTLEDFAHVDSLNLGGAKLEQFDAVVSPVPFLVSRSQRNIKGILGWPAFMGGMITIDYRRHLLTIRRGELPPSDGNEVVPLTLEDDYHMFVRASIDGQDISLAVDTGCESGVVIPEDNAKRLHWLGAPVPVTAEFAASTAASSATRLDGKLCIGGRVERNPIVVSDKGVALRLLGAGVLRHYEVTFDFKNRRMRLKPAPRLLTAVFRNLTFQCDRRTVVSVDAGGAAARAGIEVGDEVVALNGIPVDPLGMQCVTGRAIIRGPAVIVTGPEVGKKIYTLALGETLAIGSGDIVEVIYFAEQAEPTTGPSVFQTLPIGTYATVGNWAENDPDVLFVELKRDGKTVLKELPIKPELAPVYRRPEVCSTVEGGFYMWIPAEYTGNITLSDGTVMRFQDGSAKSPIGHNIDVEFENN